MLPDGYCIVRAQEQYTNNPDILYIKCQVVNLEYLSFQVSPLPTLWGKKTYIKRKRETHIEWKHRSVKPSGLTRTYQMYQKSDQQLSVYYNHLASSRYIYWRSIWKIGKWKTESESLKGKVASCLSLTCIPWAFMGIILVEILTHLCHRYSHINLPSNHKQHLYWQTASSSDMQYTQVWQGNLNKVNYKLNSITIAC